MKYVVLCIFLHKISNFIKMCFISDNWTTKVFKGKHEHSMYNIKKMGHQSLGSWSGKQK